MSRKCQISGKGPMSGNTRSHALNSTAVLFLFYPIIVIL